MINREKLIRLAKENPSLAAKLLKMAEKAKTEEGAKKLYEKYLDGLTPEGRRNTKKKPQDFYEKPSKDESSKSKGDDSGSSTGLTDKMLEGIKFTQGNKADLKKKIEKEVKDYLGNADKHDEDSEGDLEDYIRTLIDDASYIDLGDVDPDEDYPRGSKERRLQQQEEARGDALRRSTKAIMDDVKKALADKKKSKDKAEKKPSDSKSKGKSKPSGGSPAKPQHKRERDDALFKFFDGTDLSPNEKRVIIKEVDGFIEEARSNAKWRAVETDTGFTPHGLLKELKGNIAEAIDDGMIGIDQSNVFDKLGPLVEKLVESAKKERYNDPKAKSDNDPKAKPEKKPRENGELPIGDKGQQKRKQMSKAEKLKAYQEAIKNSKSMSPEDKKKALEKSKKPGFDADAALGAMGEEEEEGGKKASLTKASAWAGEFTYQVVTDGNKVQRYSEKDFMRKFRSKIVGYTPEGGRLREELWEQPKVRGLLGPMWNGIQGGKAEIRYEDLATNKRMSLASSKVAHRPYLTSEGLDSRKVNKGEGFMLYMIDQAKNNSKFYEGVMLDNGDGTYRVLLRWGALTDSGFTGRIDGEKFDDRMSALSEREAKAVLMKKYRDKTRKGYVDAFKHKLSKGQYPVGLKRDVGFGWGTQESAFCTPALRAIQDLLRKAQTSLSRMDLSGAAALQDEAAQMAKSDRSTMLKKVNDNIQHMQGRAESIMAMPDPSGRDVRVWSTAMSRLISYLDKQLSVCHTASQSTLTANDKLRYTRLAASFPKGSAQRMAALQVLLGSKMITKEKLIRLAKENPSLAAKLLKMAEKAKTEEGAKKLYEKYLEGLTPEGRRNTKKKPQDFFEKPSKDKPSKGKSDSKSSVKKLEETKKKIDDIDDAAWEMKMETDFIGTLESNASKSWSSLSKKEKDAIYNRPMAYQEKLKANKALNEAVSVAKGFGVDFDLEAAGITKEFWGKALTRNYVKLDDVVQSIVRKLNDKMQDLEDEADKLSKEVEAEGGKKASFRSKIIRLAHENPELRVKLLPLIKEARDKKQALDRDARSEFWVSGIAGGMNLLWTVKVFAKNQREADKAAETLVWSASPTVEWQDSRGRPLSREVIPTKAQLNYMDIEAD